jgi:peptide deformylase
MLERVCRSEFIIPEWLIPEMFYLLRQHNAMGLAAPQVGVDAGLFVTEWGEVFVNPVIIHKFQPTMSQEWCLSLPGFSATKRRWLNIVVNNHRYQGTQAIVIQHELDHLNGITLETEGTEK